MTTLDLVQLPSRSRARDDDGADGFETRATFAVAGPKNLTYTTMTQYDKKFTLPFVLPPEHPDNILADVMAQRELEESAGSGNGKIRARDVLLQRRQREALRGRRARTGGVAEGRDLRLEARNERRRASPKKWSERSSRRIRRHRDELCERRHGGALGQDGSTCAPSKRWMRD